MVFGGGNDNGKQGSSIPGLEPCQKMESRLWFFDLELDR